MVQVNAAIHDRADIFALFAIFLGELSVYVGNNLIAIPAYSSNLVFGKIVRIVASAMVGSKEQ